MKSYEKSIIPMLESLYDTFTPIEKNIANFFINNKDETDFSAKHISQLLYTSEAALSRFSKKCGFNGYREFIYRYMDSLSAVTLSMDHSTRNILNVYQKILNKSYDLIDEEQIQRICQLLLNKNRVYIYGKGNSGFVAQDVRLRFLQVGVDVHAITDDHLMMIINGVMIHSDTLVIGISVSGCTESVLSALKEAKGCGGTTVLITSKKRCRHRGYCDEILLIPSIDSLSFDQNISAQVASLVMIDILFAHYLQFDQERKAKIYDYTVQRLGDFREKVEE